MGCEIIKTEAGIQEVHCDTAACFLQFLLQSDDRWLNDETQETIWVFRGHFEENWKLIPSALRIENTQYFQLIKDNLQRTSELWDLVNDLIPGSLSVAPHLVHIFYQAASEVFAVQNFIAAADNAGLPIPDDQYSREFGLSIRSFLPRLTQSIDWQPSWKRPSFTPGKLHENLDLFPWYLESDVVALAQHHGVPTRLLDWTEDPFVAAYFATVGNDNKRETPNIAVWALRISKDPSKHFRLRLIAPRRHRIGYLWAQRGVFVFDRWSNNYYRDHKTWQALEDTVASLETYAFRKITLPADQIDDLRHRLKMLRMEPYYLMPSYDNVASALRVAAKNYVPIRDRFFPG